MVNMFSEKYDNENLWLKYANSHKGFVLEYDVKQLLESIIFVKSMEENDRFDNCRNNAFSSAIWPVYYSKVKYDATEYAGFCAVYKLFVQNGLNDITQQLQQILAEGTYMWDAKRIVLIKKWIHHYDEEWRLLLNSKYIIKAGCQPYKICKPSRVIMGFNTADDDCQSILSEAKQAGITCCNKMVINDDDEFVLDERNLL